MTVSTGSLHRRAAVLSRFATVLIALSVASCAEHRDATPERQVATTNGSAAGTEAPAAVANRIVAIGGGVVETLVALDLAEQIVAHDSSGEGLVPGGVAVNLGSPHRLAAESVLAQRPQLVIAAASGPRNDALAGQIAAAGVEYEQLADAEDVESVAARIAIIGERVGRAARARELADTFRGQVAHAAGIAAATPESPTALLLYARGHGTLFVAGSGTLAHDVLVRAGATNAAAALEGFQPLTPEALVAGQPLWLVIPAKGLASLGGVDGLLAVPGVAQTPAGQHRNVIAMDDHRLLGGGPSMGGALIELAERLRGAPEASREVVSP